jgi:hypothetical protein
MSRESTRLPEISIFRIAIRGERAVAYPWKETRHYRFCPATNNM